MDATLSAALCSWSFSPLIVCALAAAAAVYFRGWKRLRRRGSREFGPGRLACFLLGLLTLYVALRSPLDTLAPLLLQAHMVQHLLLMLLVPPLIWLAAPELPLLAGLPRIVRADWVVPLLRLPTLRRVLAWLGKPVPAWTIAVVCLWIWHVPVMYELALRDRLVHDLEHATFFISSLMFWWPIVTPYPRRRAYSAWMLLPYLFLAGVQGTVLAGVLTFAEHVLYPHYENVPRLAGVSALTDQALAGAIMWVIGSLAYLVPLVILGRRLLYGEAPRRVPRKISDNPVRADRRPAIHTLTVLATSSAASACGSRCKTQGTGHFDLLRIPLLGPALKARHTRTVLQGIFLVVAVLIVLDGLLGPQVAPINLAGVLPWIHWRGMLVLGLLLAGNFFCMACPFTLPRRLASRWLPSSWRWPHALRNKWAAIALCVMFFWSYEQFALWDSPWWTAWLVIGYFTAALVIDGIFHGTPFCKYVCPIGQFNFVHSLVSPLEVKVRQPEVCLTCSTHACLRGNDSIRGCETALWQPQKQGNLDCTFCLDCVRSCPHDNVGLLVLAPAATLTSDPRRSGIGRLSQRADIAALVVVLAAAAFVNAAWMTAPVVAIQQWAVAQFGPSGRGWTIACGSILGLIVLPALAVAITAWTSSLAGGESPGWRTNALRYFGTLIPLSCAMWGAHYAFHLFTSGGTIALAGWRFAADLGLAGQAALDWSCPCCGGRIAGWVLPAELFILDIGLLLSLYVAYSIARRQHGRSLRAFYACAPWGALIVMLFLFGVTILLLPMQMRGTMSLAQGALP